MGPPNPPRGVRAAQLRPMAQRVGQVARELHQASKIAHAPAIVKPARPDPPGKQELKFIDGECHSQVPSERARSLDGDHLDAQDVAPALIPLESETSNNAETDSTDNTAYTGADIFFDGESWPSTPRSHAAVSENVALVDCGMRCTIQGVQTDIKLPRQKFRKGGTCIVQKGYAEVGGKVLSLAVKTFNSTEDPQVIRRETTIWHKLNHANVLPLYGAWKKSRGCPQPIYALVSPYMKHGTLDDYLGCHFKVEKLRLMTEVAAALTYLHDEARIVHGDIKMVNILVADDGRALLSDFGLSTTVVPGPHLTVTHIRWRYTLEYCAPEILDDAAEDASGRKRSKTIKSDAYAYGMLLYLTYLRGPYSRAQAPGMCSLVANTIHKGLLPPRPTNRPFCPVMCDDLWEICRQCWDLNPSSRPHMVDILGKLKALSQAGISRGRPAGEQKRKQRRDGSLSDALGIGRPANGSITSRRNTCVQ